MRTFVIVGFIMSNSLNGYNEEGVNFQKEIQANSLYQASMIFSGIYPEESIYRIDFKNCYMKL